MLSRLLGEMSGTFNMGEAMRWLFNTRRMSRTTPCGCGEAVLDCSFWQSIVPKIENSEIQRIGTQLIRIRNLPWLVSPVKPGRIRQHQNQLVEATRALLGEIAEKSGSGILIDSSKNSANAYLIGQLPEVELCVIHLVRDPRGVVSSWQKPKGHLKSFPLRTSLGWWMAYDLSATALRTVASRFLMLRFEDFLGEPEHTLRSIAQEFQIEADPAAFMQGRQAWIGRQHLLGSNPDKFTGGAIMIQPRDWQLARPRRVAVTLITLPFLLKYGYLGRSP